MLLFLLGSYFIVSTTEYCVHRFLLHAHPFRIPAVMRGWPMLHIVHHYQECYPGSMELKPDSPGTGLLFSWTETFVFVLLTLPFFLLLGMATGSHWCVDMVACVVLCYMDTGVHNYCHCLAHGRRVSLFMCPCIPAPLALVATINRHHAEHHKTAGKRNFCVVFLGADVWCRMLWREEPHHRVKSGPKVSAH